MMKHSMRNWHTWTSVALGIPLLLVGLTTFFIAHEKSLGTKDIQLPLQVAAYEALEIRAAGQVGNEQWIGTKQGVFRLDGAQAVPVAASPADEIRDMAQAGNAVVLAGKKGLWRIENGQSTQAYKGDCWQVMHQAGQGFTAACKNAGLLVSPDASQWTARAVEFPAEALQAAASGMTLSKLIMDMHTGKLFFGKEYEWIWIDLLGLACVGLGLTGLVMWMRSRRQRALVG